MELVRWGQTIRKVGGRGYKFFCADAVTWIRQITLDASGQNVI
ncbi:hypothetical protein HMPREF0083_01203 [Aneurinibacillus aneurinilyticus ATCC 12856]|uniref:Uncharacterized protein n=1 Tax=Aneurinibacillus aneurinilyticus ATCC 12856 TaxID=649747 RepID=U1WQ15_ANEAE|nr:hypothetical protein HMPREF0083_01203 [Aneurinibacillus aneurinilyticus ATCC 12856]